MNPFVYPYGYRPTPPPLDPGRSIPITTTNPQGMTLMAPHDYISAAPTPAHPVYYQGVGTVSLGGSVPHVATVPPACGMQHGQGMAGVEYPTVSSMSGALPSAMLMTTSELTQFPTPGSESVSASYVPHASRGEFISLAVGNFGSPYVVPVPTSPPALTCMSIEPIPRSSSEGICPSTSAMESVLQKQSQRPGGARPALPVPPYTGGLGALAGPMPA